MVDYLEKIFLPYVKSKREELGLSATYPALAIFDEFNGQMTDAVFGLLKKNHIYYVIVPPNSLLISQQRNYYMLVFSHGMQKRLHHRSEETQTSISLWNLN